MTAVEWLEETSKRRNLVPGDFEQAKEMEKEKMIKFAKHCLDKSIDLDILMAYNQVEIEYTNQTFKSEQTEDTLKLVLNDIKNTPEDVFNKQWASIKKTRTK